MQAKIVATKTDQGLLLIDLHTNRARLGFTSEMTSTLVLAGLLNSILLVITIYNIKNTRWENHLIEEERKREEKEKEKQLNHIDEGEQQQQENFTEESSDDEEIEQKSYADQVKGGCIFCLKFKYLEGATVL